MATLRKANAYSKKKVVANTRTSRRKNRAYIKAVPNSKVVKYNMGKGDKTKLMHYVRLISAEPVQIRHNAMEACRQYVNKKLDRNFSGNYTFKIVPYPHHVQRENKMLTGAGADRMQTGMQRAFGKSAGKAAILKAGTVLFEFHVADEKAVQFTRGVLKQIKPKLPGKIKILHDDLTPKSVTISK